MRCSAALLTCCNNYIRWRGKYFIYHSCVCSSQYHIIYLLPVLAAGEGRVFQSPNYPSNYPNLQACTYNFEPAAGAQLRFSCSDFDLTATSAAGALCTGDYLR